MRGRDTIYTIKCGGLWSLSWVSTFQCSPNPSLTSLKGKPNKLNDSSEQTMVELYFSLPLGLTGVGRCLQLLLGKNFSNAQYSFEGFLLDFEFLL